METENSLSFINAVGLESQLIHEVLLSQQGVNCAVFDGRTRKPKL
jgi:hypothetical protein